MNKGNSLIEFCIVFTVMMMLLFGIELIYRGWSQKISALCISRYISSYSLRNGQAPMMQDISQKFYVEPDAQLSIPDNQSITISFYLFGLQKKLTIQQTLWIWRPRAGLF